MPLFNNRRQTIPALFVAIMENEAKRKDLTKGQITAIETARELRPLREEFNTLKLAAENFLRRKGTNIDGSV